MKKILMILAVGVLIGWGAVAQAVDMEWVAISEPNFTGSMSKYETTNAQYCEFLNYALASGDIIVDGNDAIGANGSNSGTDYIGQLYYDSDGQGATVYGATNGGTARINYNGGQFSVDSGFENHPVTYVNWYGATAFCNYYGYRLPTEWEWQAVADFDGSYTYGCGTSINTGIANYLDSIHPDGTTSVGDFGAYGYGMCDISGNVWEWTNSCYYVNCNPDSRVVRGGCWDAGSASCTVLLRGKYTPTFTNYDLGFRVASGTFLVSPNGGEELTAGQTETISWEKGTTVYSNGFEGSIGPNWSNDTNDTTPGTAEHSPDRFLGQFYADDSVVLTINNLPSHTELTVSFDLYIIKTWDGISSGYVQPDIWDLSVSGGSTLLHTTFGNYVGIRRQSYPGTYPGGDYESRTGAAENNTLGFTFEDSGIKDSVYSFEGAESFTFSHSGDSVSLVFSSDIGDINPNEESWGIDNVEVSIIDINEVKLEYSANDGNSWSVIDSNTTNDGSYDWTVPTITSNQCLIKISDVNDANIYDTSDDVFTIFRCLHPTGDLNKDCFVDFLDFALMVANWVKSGNIDDGLVAYWSFDEGSGTTAQDVIGGNNGTLNGDPNWVDGISEKALDFDGSGDCVGLPSSSSLSFNSPSEPFSTSFWIKPDTVIPGEQTILENEDDYFVHLDGGVLNYSKTDSGNLYHNTWQSTNPEISAGNWAHVVITYDGTGAGGTKMYVNGIGVSVTNGAYHGGGSASGDDFAIGARAYDFLSYPYGGKIDEVRIYNRALTAAEIEYLYQNP